MQSNIPEPMAPDVPIKPMDLRRNSSWTSLIRVALFEVRAPFELFENDRCPFGQPFCSDVAPCLGHEEWKRLKLAQKRFLEKTTIYDVAVKKRKRQP